jgi:thiamine biosynthesis lipoprotein
MEENKKKAWRWKLPFLVVLLVGSFLIIRQQQKENAVPYRSNTGMIFGTIYHITYQNEQDLQKEIEQELMKVDASLSPFNAHSVITHINNNEAVELDSMFVEVFRTAMQVSEETNGAFDITVAPLVNAWGFGFKNDSLMTREKIDSIRKFVGYKKVSLAEGKVVKQDDRTMLDCSAIAKGYGCDVAARLLERKGINNYMVEIGGEIVVKGKNSQRTAWNIGVNKPVDDSLSTDGEIQTILQLSDIAMATSGNYRNFYYKEGKKYAHTIDPKTGYPVQHSILSATVLAGTCVVADAYATSFMVMGLERAKQVLKAHPELLAYFIYADEKGTNRVYYSPELERKIKK